MGLPGMPLYRLDWGDTFKFVSDPEGPTFRLLRGNGMFLWIERVGERGKYSARVGSRVFKVEVDADELG